MTTVRIQTHVHTKTTVFLVETVQSNGDFMKLNGDAGLGWIHYEDANDSSIFCYEEGARVLVTH